MPTDLKICTVALLSCFLSNPCFYYYIRYCYCKNNISKLVFKLELFVQHSYFDCYSASKPQTIITSSILQLQDFVPWFAFWPFNARVGVFLLSCVFPATPNKLEKKVIITWSWAVAGIEPGTPGPS